MRICQELSGREDARGLFAGTRQMARMVREAWGGDAELYAVPGAGAATQPHGKVLEAVAADHALPAEQEADEGAEQMLAAVAEQHAVPAPAMLGRQ